MANDHRVRGMVPDFEGVKKLVPIPADAETVNTLFPDANTSVKMTCCDWCEGPARQACFR